MSILGIGIDPGLTNFGFAIVEKTGPYSVQSLFNNTFSIDQDNLIKSCLDLIDNIRSIIQANMSPMSYDEVHIGIERFVTFGGVHAAASEDICVLIGMLISALDRDFPGIRRSEAPPLTHIHLPRSFEWKNSLVRKLCKNAGFDNPTLKLDKKFSMAAAKHICVNNNVIKNDHEADSICIASYKLLG